MQREIIRRDAHSDARLRREFVRCRWQFWAFLRSKSALWGALLLVFAMLAAAVRAAAQGCAMCYQNAAAAGAQGSATLRHAILILLVPAVTMFSGVFGLIYLRRNTAR